MQTKRDIGLKDQYYAMSKLNNALRLYTRFQESLALFKSIGINNGLPIRQQYPQKDLTYMRFSCQPREIYISKGNTIDPHLEVCTHENK